MGWALSQDFYRARLHLSDGPLGNLGATDLYFRVADNEAELPFLAQAKLTPIPSIWGHRARNPAANPADAAFIRDRVTELLDSSGNNM